MPLSDGNGQIPLIFANFSSLLHFDPQNRGFRGSQDEGRAVQLSSIGLAAPPSELLAFKY